MEIKVKETGYVEKWNIYDPNTGCCYIEDFIGNNGGWDDFEYDEDEGVYVVSKEAFDWWANVVDNEIALNYRVAELEKIRSDDVHEILNDIFGYYDLDTVYTVANKALDDAFGKEN